MQSAAASRLPESGARSLSAGRPQQAPAIDLVHLSRQTFGDRALEVQLLRMFDHQSVLIVQRLGQCGEGDRKARADLAHTIKGSARAVGAIGVAAAAQWFEDRVETAPESALQEAYRLLVQRVEEARREILRLLAD